jgi:hypothetical protein
MTTMPDLDEICRRAGMEKDDPLRLALVAVSEAARMAQETCAGARGLTPGGEAELIQRVRAGVVAGIRSEVRAIVRQSAWEMAFMASIAGMVLLLAAWALGRWG